MFRLSKAVCQRSHRFCLLCRVCGAMQHGISLMTLLAQWCQGMVQPSHVYGWALSAASLPASYRKGPDPPAQVETAVALWRRMPEAGVAPMHGTLATVLRACRIAYQGERALSLLVEARAAGAHAGLDFRGFRVATVLRACRIAYQGKRALSLLAEARAAGAPAGRWSHSNVYG